MPVPTHRTKFQSFLELDLKQRTRSLPKNNLVYQRNVVLNFKKPMKISKKELLQMLGKKNRVIQGTFALQNNKIMLISETKQVQKQSHPQSFRKRNMKTNFTRKENQNIPQQTIKEETKVIKQKKRPTNVDILRKYFAKNHLFKSETGSSREINHLKGQKLMMSSTALVQSESRYGQSLRQQRMEKRNRSIYFVNNFMRTRYKTVHNEDKQICLAYRQNKSTHSLMNCVYEPWQKKEEYDQFQL